MGLDFFKKLEIQDINIKDIIDYNQYTGQFSWKIFRGGAAKQGCIAGTITTHGYWDIRIKNKHYLAHRLAWLYVYGYWPDHEIDHIDGNPLNNKICNLRRCTKNQNEYNKIKYKNNKSGHKGVSWAKERNKWFVQIRVNGKLKPLGRYDCFELASFIYQEAARKWHGEFCKF